MVYTSTEQYTDFVELEARKEYSFVLENENNQTGAARMILNCNPFDVCIRERTCGS